MAAAVLVSLVALLLATRAGASPPYNPIFEFTAISSGATGANANITFSTALPRAATRSSAPYGLEISR